MGNVRGGVIGERKRPRSYVVEEFVPLSTCAEVCDCHYLIFSLPGFKKEEVRIQVQDSGSMVTISGERQVNHKKYMYFEKNFEVPENCGVTRSVRELEGHVFYVIFPKKVIEKKRSEEGEKEKGSGCDWERREKVGVWKSGGLILTALAAISVVVYVCYRGKWGEFN